MHKLWNYVSNLGISIEDNKLNQRAIVISNQLNFVVFNTMLLLLIAVITTALLTDGIIYLGTLRIAITLIVSVLNLILSKYGYTQLSRLSLVYLSPIVFLLGPTLIGYVEEEGYTYYPYVLICVSIIPQLLFHPKQEKLLFWFSLAYYFVLVVFIDKIMVYFATTSFPIVERINTFYPFYKIAHITLFVFINASIYYLRRLNFRFESELSTKNQELDKQNIELRVQKNEIERQKDELISKEIITWQKLVNIITHEIVNSAIPITNLAGMSAQMLEDESGVVQKPEKIGEEVTEDIHHSLKIIESRTQGLINFVKATKGLTEIPKPNLRKLFIHDLFDRVAVLFRARFKEMGVEFKMEIIPPDIHIEADLELIEQVIINLIQNALEAMQGATNRKLSLIAVMNSDKHVEISVSDIGKGISNEDLGKIFLPYYSTKVNSSGIGLSLSQQIMMLHHARIEVSSIVNKGSTFTLMF
jgi:signal transduction histidine kinase